MIPWMATIHAILRLAIQIALNVVNLDRLQVVWHVCRESEGLAVEVELSIQRSPVQYNIRTR